MKRSSRFAVLVAGVGLGLGPLALTAPAAVADTNLPQQACLAGTQLVAAAHPGAARDLAVAALTTSTDPCLDRLRTQAESAISAAQELAAKARDESAGDPAQARADVKAALALDADNSLAPTVLAGLPAAPPTPTISTLSTRWDTFFAAYLTPFQNLALPMLAVLAALLALARLATALPLGWSRTRPWQRRLAWTAGLLAACAASVLLTFGVAHQASDEGHPRSAWPLAVGSGFGLIGVALVALAMATRLRLSIQVRDSSGAVDESATGHVIALLGQLGAEPPHGLEVPRGADTTALDGTPIAGIPDGAIISAFLRVWQLVFNATPWRVTVEAEDDADVHSVAVTRNGHLVASGVVNRDLLGLRTAEPQPDLHRFAAAMVLTTLSAHYPGFESLYDVTDWRSLGLHDVATSDFARRPELAQAALARAVSLDPHNLPALVALRHVQDRESTEADALLSYREYLLLTSRALEPLDYAYEMRIRVLLTLLATACNLSALDGSGTVPDDVVAAGDQLLRLLASPPERARPMALAMRSSAACAYLSAGGTQMAGWARGWLAHPHLFDPRGHYNYACRLAGQGRTAEALEHLRLAAADPEMAASIKTDPWLAGLRDTDAYRSTYHDEPCRDLLELAPFAPHATALREAGWASAHDVALTGALPLSRYLKVDLAIGRRLARLAEVVTMIPAGPFDGLEVEIASTLLGLGIDSPEMLAERAGVELAEQVFTDVRGRCRTYPTLEALLAWLAPDAFGLVVLL